MQLIHIHLDSFRCVEDDFENYTGTVKPKLEVACELRKETIRVLNNGNGEDSLDLSDLPGDE